MTNQPAPGAVHVARQAIYLNPGRRTVEMEVVSVGDRPIQVGSHYAFHEVNSALRFDRDAARGMRLDIPAGTAVRFEPGERRDVRLVELGGRRHVFGHRGMTNGPLDGSG